MPAATAPPSSRGQLGSKGVEGSLDRRRMFPDAGFVRPGVRIQGPRAIEERVPLFRRSSTPGDALTDLAEPGPKPGCGGRPECPTEEGKVLRWWWRRRRR